MATIGVATRGSRWNSPKAFAPLPIWVARCCWRSVRNRCSPPRPCGRGLTRPPHRGRSRRCVKNTADHRQITEALADAYVLGHLPDFGAVRQGPARKLDLPTYPFQHRQYWYQATTESAPTSNRHVTGVRVPKPSVFSRTAGSRNSRHYSASERRRSQTLNVLTKLAAQHNQQRKTQSIADDRYEFRWEKSTATASGCGSRRGVYLAAHRR